MHGAGGRLRIERLAVEIGEERELILERHVHIDVNFVAVGECAHHVRGAALGTLEPANVLSVAAAFEDAEPSRQSGIPGKMHLALLSCARRSWP